MTTLQDKTPEELTRMLAELLGKCTHGPEHWEHEGPEGDRELVCMICNDSLRNLRVPPYATSYDAIMPILRGLEWSQKKKHAEWMWQVVNSNQIEHILYASPADLTRALILVLQSK